MSDETTIRLLLVRHGETELNHGHRMQGWSDHALNDRGRRQVRALAERLACETIDRVFASDLPRARETAEILAAPHGLAVATDERLREQDFGRWEGAGWPDLEGVAAPGEVERFLSDPSFEVPEGESKARVRDRLESFVRELVARGQEETVLVVSHGGPIQILIQEALEIPWSVKKRLYPTNAGLTELLRVDDYWRLVTFDGKSHLPPSP